MLHEQQMKTNNEMHNYRPFPTTQRERQQINYRKVITFKKYTMSNNNMATYRKYQVATWLYTGSTR
jgi:hypothetical protein